jgi:hypothetical protein
MPLGRNGGRPSSWGLEPDQGRRRLLIGTLPSLMSHGRLSPECHICFAVVDFVLDFSVAIDRTKRLSRKATGRDKIVEVPPDRQPLPPAAQRTLVEAEERERQPEPSAQAASGTDQAS